MSITLDPLYIFPPDGGYYTSFDDVGKTDKLKTDQTQQQIADAIFIKQKNNQYGNLNNVNRFAICFLPGIYTYTNVIEVAFYTTLSGLGLNPGNVTINSMNDGRENPVRCTYKYDDTFLTNFWRSCENMKLQGDQTYWYVSQAAPLNNMIIEKELLLSDGQAFASGGFIGNSKIGDKTTVDSQQQWCNLNSNFNKFSNTVWNLTNIGCDGNTNLIQNPVYGDSSFTTINPTPRIAGKPYLYYNNSFNIVKPGVQLNVSGPLTTSDYTLIDTDKIFYANPTNQNDINAKITAGFSIVLTPGIYNLTTTITISKDGIIILGLGMATLVAPSGGGPAILVGDDVSDLRLSSFIIQANTENIANKPQTPVLLQIGVTPQNPLNGDGIFLDNIFIKVGPELTIYDKIDVETMVIINTNGVVASNLWLWRADHGPLGLIVIDQSKCNNGLIVNGDDVCIYGLFVEHTSVKLIQWTGANGKLYFLQSEYPYDVTNAFDNPCLTVGDKGTGFEGQALGVYCFFRDHKVTVQNAISCLNTDITIVNAFTVWLNDNPLISETANSVITHVINETGNSANKETKGIPQYVPSYPGPVCFCEGTKILCYTQIENSLICILKEEYRLVQHLKIGDLVKSYLHGYRKVSKKLKGSFVNNPKDEGVANCMYRMKKTKDNGLIEDLTLTRNHGVLVEKLTKNEEEKLDKNNLPIIDGLLSIITADSDKFEKVLDTNVYKYYHFSLNGDGDNDRRFGVWANGLLVETPSNNMMDGVLNVKPLDF